MARKREEARQAAEAGATAKAHTAARVAGGASAQAAAAKRAEEQDQERSVIPWLRALGYRADQARHAAERCEVIPDAPLEERVRLALSCLAPRVIRRRRAGR